MSGTNSAVKAKELDCHPSVARVLVIGKDAQLGQPFEQCLAAHNCEFDYAHGSADAMRRVRQVCYSVVITDPKTGIEEDLALLAEMRSLRPGVRVIVLAQSGTPERDHCSAASASVPLQNRSLRSCRDCRLRGAGREHYRLAGGNRGAVGAS